jgi:glycosyltransferase involved in cell wall biosynthesis
MSSSASNTKESPNVNGNNPLVSVIIPCYNHARYLTDSIQSVLSQTYSNYEIVVVDDGSEDHPELVAAQYPQVSFQRQENQGPSKARNNGWQRSNGSFLVFLDADDRLLPHALEAGLRCFAEYPECAFVFGNGRVIDSEGNQVELLVPALRGANYEELLEGNSVTCPAQVMYRRAALESVGGFASFVNNRFIANASDYDISLRLANLYPIRPYDELIAEWRQHTSNISSNSLKMLQSCVTILNAQRPALKGKPEQEEALRKGLKRIRIHYGERLIEELRSQARTGNINWRKFAASILALGKYYPRGLIDNVLRKTKSVVLPTRH